MFDLLLAVGDLTGAKMNREKCLEPAQIMVILGFVYDSISRICRLSEKKVKKYLSRIETVLNSPRVQFKQLEKLVGNLTYTAWIAPFARPFLPPLSEKLYLSKDLFPIALTPAMRNALNI